MPTATTRVTPPANKISLYLFTSHDFPLSMTRFNCTVAALPSYQPSQTITATIETRLLSIPLQQQMRHLNDSCGSSCRHPHSLPVVNPSSLAPLFPQIKPMNEDIGDGRPIRPAAGCRRYLDRGQLQKPIAQNEAHPRITYICIVHDTWSVSCNRADP